MQRSKSAESKKSHLEQQEPEVDCGKDRKSLHAEKDVELKDKQQVVLRIKPEVKSDQLAHLKKKIESLEKWKQDMVHNARKELGKLDRIHRDLESKGRLILKEQENKIKSLKKTQEDELKRYRSEVERLKETISEEKKEYADKEKIVRDLEQMHEGKLADLASDEKKFMEEIEVEKQKLAELQETHRQKQKEYEDEIDKRRTKFHEAKNQASEKINALDNELLKRKEEYDKEIGDLQKEVSTLQGEIKRKQQRGKAEIDKLMQVKDDIILQLDKVQQRIGQTKVQEEERIAQIMKDHQSQYIEVATEFENEAKPKQEELDKLRSMIRDREAELETYREEKERQHQQAADRVSQKLKEIDDQILALKSKSKKELREREEALQIHFADLDSKILQKQQDVLHLENDFVAEEALLKLQLDALIEHERVHNAEDPEKKKQFASRLQRLEEEASRAKQVADDEEEKYKTMKKNFEVELTKKRKKLEAKAASATSKINALDDNIIQLKAELRAKKDALKNVDNKAQQRMDALKDDMQAKKESLAHELGMLKETFCDLANRLKLQKKEKSQVIQSLEQECQDQRQVQESDIAKLQNLISVLRHQGEKVHNSLEMELKDLLESNKNLKKKYEAEVNQLQEEMANKHGGENDPEYSQLLSQYQQLKTILPQRQDELKDLQHHKRSADKSPESDSETDDDAPLNQEIAVLTEKIQRQSEILLSEGNPVFQNGGLAHQLYQEKSKHDQLLEEYCKKKNALETEMKSRQEKKVATDEDGNVVESLRKLVVTEVDENEALQKEIQNLEALLKAQQSTNGTQAQSHDASSEMLEVELDGHCEQQPKEVSKADLKQELDNLNMEFDDKKSDIERRISSVRGELISTKRQSWKQKEVQEKEMQDLQKQKDENRKRSKADAANVKIVIMVPSSGATDSPNTEKPNKDQP